MQILIVSATEAEVAPVVARLTPFHCEGSQTPLNRYIYGTRGVDVLISGVGMVATAAWCSRVLAEGRYDFALNLGVCGSFDSDLPPGTVVHVVSDRIAEMGAEDDEAFVAFEDLHLPGPCELASRATPSNSEIATLPAVRGITVNTVHGNPRSIAAVIERFKPQVESMEGAAFMYSCLIHDIPYAQLRAVSNVVEKRNRSAWKIGDAIENLGRTALRALEAV